jgi:hypothetical protein
MQLPQVLLLLDVSKVLLTFFENIRFLVFLNDPGHQVQYWGILKYFSVSQKKSYSTTVFSQ